MGRTKDTPMQARPQKAAHWGVVSYLEWKERLFSGEVVIYRKIAN
jgi:hypothetical protein